MNMQILPSIAGQRELAVRLATIDRREQSAIPHEAVNSLVRP